MWSFPRDPLEAPSDWNQIGLAGIQDTRAAGRRPVEAPHTEPLAKWSTRGRAARQVEEGRRDKGSGKRAWLQGRQDK
eukprot:scaffold165765_cov34-Tisochrysis_lutea.AAC.2